MVAMVLGPRDSDRVGHTDKPTAGMVLGMPLLATGNPPHRGVSYNG